MITATWIPATHSHAGQFGTVAFTGDFNQSYGTLTFQDGSLKEFGENGLTNEIVIQALIDRLKTLNTPPFNCAENAQAINHLRLALVWLNQRTTDRINRGVEGTTTP